MSSARPDVANAFAANTEQQGRARPIRVLFCVDTFHVGGSELNAIRTAERLAGERIQISVACLKNDGPLKARYEAAGIPVTEFPMSNLYGYRTIRQGLRFAAFVNRGRFDVVQTHDVYTNMFAVPWAAVSRSAAILACRRWWTETPRALHRVLNRQSYRLADGVLANSAAIATLLEREEKVPASKISVVPNFVDEEAFETPPSDWVRAMRERLAIGPGDLTIGMVANLHPIKNHDLLIGAAANLLPRWPQLKVVIVGDGVRRAALEQSVRERGMTDRVTFAGLMPHAPSPHHLFDISVLTSWAEGFPNSIVEAMAAGRPIIATAAGGVVDAFANGVAGQIVPAGDMAQFTAGLEELLRSPEKRSAFGNAAREEAMRRYHARRVLPQLEAVYTRLAAARRVRTAA